LLAPPAKLDDAGLPVICDPDLDVALYRSVLRWKESGGQWVIRRDLTLPECAALLARLAALEQATAPYTPSEKERVIGALHVMLGGFVTRAIGMKTPAATWRSPLLFFENFRLGRSRKRAFRSHAAKLASGTRIRQMIRRSRWWRSGSSSLTEARVMPRMRC